LRAATEPDFAHEPVLSIGTGLGWGLGWREDSIIFVQQTNEWAETGITALSTPIHGPCLLFPWETQLLAKAFPPLLLVSFPRCLPASFLPGNAAPRHKSLTRITSHRGVALPFLCKSLPLSGRSLETTLGGEQKAELSYTEQAQKGGKRPGRGWCSLEGIQAS
jgi:hypothetical protein